MDIIKIFPEGFPLTIERLQFVQTAYTKAIKELAGGVTGNGVILSGVVDTAGVLSDGVIVTPAGEIIAFVGGATDPRVAIFETVHQVPYNVDNDNDGNLDLKDSDVVRVAMCHPTDGVDSFLLADLKRVNNLRNIMPIGIILPYEGLDTDILPAGWVFYTGLVDRFIMGAGGTHAVGANGGANAKPILQVNIPSYTMSSTTASAGAHTHTYQRYNEGVGSRFNYEAVGDDAHADWQIQNTSSAGAHTHSFSVNSGGGDQDFDVRPAFKALLFVKFVGF